MSSIQSFPETKYMGSKRFLLPTILSEVRRLKPRRVLDAFSGSGCVSYGLKTLGIEVHSNDFMHFASEIAKATVQNNTTVLSTDDVRRLLLRNKNADDFIQQTFSNLYFEDADNEFLDNLWANICEMNSPLKKSMALAAACRAAMKKRPRGIFTFTGRKGWDERKDLKLSMKAQFLLAVKEFNSAVFSNGKRNHAFRDDVFALQPSGYDLVYIDTPYVSPFSDCDYTRRYHFVEGFCSYWEGMDIIATTGTKKFKSYPTKFSTRAKVEEAFATLFNHFKDSTLVVSYSSNAVPSKERMVAILRNTKKKVTVLDHAHKYSFGNQRHKVGNNRNSVTEYLFIAE